MGLFAGCLPGHAGQPVYGTHQGPDQLHHDFHGRTAIVSGRDKNQVAGLELKETMVLCGRAAQRTHIKNIAVFFHWSRSKWHLEDSVW